MTEQELADQFGQDIDELMQGHQPDRASATPEYGRALALAQVLASTDLSAESQQRAPLRHHLLSQTHQAEKPASVFTAAVRVLFLPFIRRAPIMMGVALAMAVIQLAWSGDLHRGATDFSMALRETLQSAYASLPELQPQSTAPITTSVGLAASPWPMVSGSEAIATSQVPAASTTVTLGNLVVFGSPPK